MSHRWGPGGWEACVEVCTTGCASCQLSVRSLGSVTCRVLAFSKGHSTTLLAHQQGKPGQSSEAALCSMGQVQLGSQPFSFFFLQCHMILTCMLSLPLVLRATSEWRQSSCNPSHPMYWALLQGTLVAVLLSGPVPQLSHEIFTCIWDHIPSLWLRPDEGPLSLYLVPSFLHALHRDLGISRLRAHCLP